MSFSFDYRCDSCGTRGSLTHTISSYRFPDGTELPVAMQPAFCITCDTICTAEELPEESTIVDLMTRLETGELTERELRLADALDEDAETYRTRRLHLQRAMLTWRRGRESPPRCLSCGSMAWTILDRDALNGFVHPECGGTFRLVDACHFSPATRQILDTEGRPL